MPDNLDKEIKETIDNEIEKSVTPLKESVDTLTETVKLLEKEKQALLEENSSIRENFSKLNSQNRQLQETVVKLTNRNARLVKEARIISEKSRDAVLSAKSRLEEAKEALVTSTAKALESNINEINRAAFNSAKTLFEKDFSVIEDDVLKVLGATLSPYLSDKTLPSKIDAMSKDIKSLSKELESVKESAKKTISRERLARIRTEAKLKSALAQLAATKTELFKNDLISKLPSGLQEIARKKMFQVNTLSEIKRIYLTVVKESTSPVKAQEQNPVEDMPRPETVTGTTKVIKESETVRVKMSKKASADFDLGVNDPEMLRLARL